MFRRFAISFVIAMVTLPVAARTRPHYGGTLHVETEGDPWQRPDGIARRLVFDGLTTLDARGTVQSALATGWEADSGDHRWQFRLRAGGALSRWLAAHGDGRRSILEPGLLGELPVDGGSCGGIECGVCQRCPHAEPARTVGGRSISYRAYGDRGRQNTGRKCRHGAVPGH